MSSRSFGIAGKKKRGIILKPVYWANCKLGGVETDLMIRQSGVFRQVHFLCMIEVFLSCSAMPAFLALLTRVFTLIKSSRSPLGC